MLTIEIVYVAVDGTLLQTSCQLPEGSSVLDALHQSGVYVTHPETRHFATGIFSRPVTSETLLKPGDRIEIYRPLINCPKEKRRLRAKKK